MGGGGRGRGLAGRRPPMLPPSRRSDCLATANQSNIFGGVCQPIQSVRAVSLFFFLFFFWLFFSFFFCFLLVFFSVLAALSARSRSEEIILALTRLKDTWLITVY